jgi:hypothetical protein
MFFGVIYVRISYERHLRRHLFLNEIATAFLASVCPITNLSRYWTTFGGVSADSLRVIDWKIFLVVDYSMGSSIFSLVLEKRHLGWDLKAREWMEDFKV